MNALFTGIVADVNECKSKCDGNAGCISFEYWGKSNPHWSQGSGTCHTSSTCTLSLAEYNKNDSIGANSHLFIIGK